MVLLPVVQAVVNAICRDNRVFAIHFFFWQQVDLTYFLKCTTHIEILAKTNAEQIELFVRDRNNRYQWT